jgi:hypothetical protein
LHTRLYTARLPIPDNPGEKRDRKFVYRKKIDALTYGWSRASDVLSIAELLVQGVDPVNAEP